MGFTLEVAVIDTMMTKAIDGRKYVKMGIKTRAPSLILEAPSVINSGTWLIRFYCKTIYKNNKIQMHLIKQLNKFIFIS